MCIHPTVLDYSIMYINCIAMFDVQCWSFIQGGVHTHFIGTWISEASLYGSSLIQCFRCGDKISGRIIFNFKTGLPHTKWMVNVVRNLFSHFRVKSHSRKLKPQNFCCPRAQRVNGISIWHYLNYLVVLTAIEVYQQVCLWWLLFREVKVTDKQTGWRHKPKSRSDCLYK